MDSGAPSDRRATPRKPGDVYHSSARMHCITGVIIRYKIK